MRDPQIGEILVQPDDLKQKVRDLGARISADYEGRDLLAREPASLEVCALLTKPERRKVEMPTRYVGFEIPDKFAIGYGLDHAERYRNLPYVATLSLDDGAKAESSAGR